MGRSNGRTLRMLPGRGLGLVGALILLAAGAAQAKSVGGRYVAYGVGAWPCSQYQQAQSGSPRAQRAVAHFIEGYLTAFNNLVGNTYDIMDGRPADQAGQWLHQHCAAHPGQTLGNALAVYTRERYPDRASVPPKTER